MKKDPLFKFMMHVLICVFLFIVYFIAICVIAPSLVSAKSWLCVILGFALMVSIIPVIYITVKRIFRCFLAFEQHIND